MASSTAGSSRQAVAVSNTSGSGHGVGAGAGSAPHYYVPQGGSNSSSTAGSSSRRKRRRGTKLGIRKQGGCYFCGRFFDWDDVCAYNSKRMVVIRERKLGLLYYSFVVCIVAYIGKTQQVHAPAVPAQPN